jgi:beta-lactamase regulating signal transducer with metallopeptidase domain
MTCGLLRPAILLPWDAPEWSEADVERALVHEIEHVRRGDWPVQILARLVCAAYWFHPLVWIAWRQLHLSAERACDDVVLQRSDGVPYAVQLLRLAERLSGRDPHPLPAMAARSDLSARVMAVLDPRQSRGPMRMPATGATVAAAALGLVMIGPMSAEEAQRTPGPDSLTFEELAFEVVSIRPRDDRVPVGDSGACSRRDQRVSGGGRRSRSRGGQPVQRHRVSRG